jgi:hypothetical protein
VFVHAPAGSVLHLEPVTSPVLVYAGSFAEPVLEPDDAAGDDLQRYEIDALPWTDMSWRGDEAPSPDVKIKWIRGAENELGIAFVDPSDNLRAAPSPAYVLSDYTHFASNGHDAIAKVIADEINRP